MAETALHEMATPLWEAPCTEALFTEAPLTEAPFTETPPALPVQSAPPTSAPPAAPPGSAPPASRAALDWLTAFNGYVSAIRDRTRAEQESAMRAELEAERLLTQRLRHAALHDPLTGLPNRAAAFEHLAGALSAPGARVGLCYVDLDGFKAVNDRYGHGTGDQLLGAVAERIGRVARGHDAIAARLGGDEFVVLACDSPGLQGMIALASGILAEVSRPVTLAVARVRVSACAGIVERPAAGTTAQALVADADAALYRAKSSGAGTLAVHGLGVHGLGVHSLGVHSLPVTAAGTRPPA